MTIILCKTITANTFHSKTILEFNDDQSLYLFLFFSHYSLQFLFYINVSIQKIHTSITSISDVFSIHFLRQIKTLFLFSSNTTRKQQLETLLLSASLATQKHDSKFLCFHSSTSSFSRKF